MTSSPRPPHVGYLLDNARAEAGERFVWLAELFDGVTRGHFDRLGVRAGSRCWEVGAGGPGIPEALAAAVGPTGHVLATDIDPSWLNTGGGYEVRRPGGTRSTCNPMRWRPAARPMARPKERRSSLSG